MEKQTNKAGGKWFNKKNMWIFNSKAAKTSTENTEKKEKNASFIYSYMTENSLANQVLGRPNWLTTRSFTKRAHINAKLVPI